MADIRRTPQDVVRSALERERARANGARESRAESVQATEIAEQQSTVDIERAP